MPDGAPVDDHGEVLIVDDEPDTVSYYVDTLVDDYSVRTAESGEAALESLDADVDVVLLDRRMPGLSGDEVLARIRERGVDCRVVMVTAVDPDVDVIDLAFDDYLVKPVSPDELADAVERMFVRKDLDETLRELLALGTRMATLEAKMDVEELEASERYAALEARFSELRDSLDLGDEAVDPYGRLSATKLEALLERH